MNSEEQIQLFWSCINVIITYTIIPFCLRRKKKYTFKEAYKISFINTICVFAIYEIACLYFCIVKLSTDLTLLCIYSIFNVLIAIFFFYLGKLIITYGAIEDVNVETDSDAKKYKTIKKKQKKKIVVSDKALYCILAILFVILVVILGNIAYNKYNNLQNEVENLKTRNTELTSESKEIKDKNMELIKQNLDYISQIDFMNRYVAICPIDGSGLYHLYGCEKMSTSHFYIYNTEQAIERGYTPCSCVQEALNN